METSNKSEAMEFFAPLGCSSRRFSQVAAVCINRHEKLLCVNEHSEATVLFCPRVRIAGKGLYVREAAKLYFRRK